MTLRINDDIEMNLSSNYMALEYELTGPDDFVLRVKNNSIETGFIEKKMTGTLTFPATLEKRDFEIRDLENDGQYVRMICTVLKHQPSLEATHT